MTNPSKASLLEFPCEFPIKAFGLATQDLVQTVLEIVQRHSPETRPDQVYSRNSEGGKYIAVTVTIVASSQSQIDAIYMDLTASPDVLMAL